MSMIQCPNCKSMVDNSGAFCPNCGTPIAAAPEAPVQPVQAQPSQPVIVGMSQKNRSKGLGIAGLILSAIALCIWLIVLAAIGIAVL